MTSVGSASFADSVDVHSDVTVCYLDGVCTHVWSIFDCVCSEVTVVYDCVCVGSCCGSSDGAVSSRKDNPDSVSAVIEVGLSSSEGCMFFIDVGSSVIVRS